MIPKSVAAAFAHLKADAEKADVVKADVEKTVNHARKTVNRVRKSAAVALKDEDAANLA